MKYLLILPFVLASCATSPNSSTPTGTETYRYMNSLDFGKDNILDSVVVTGHDESGVKETTRIDVKIGAGTIQLRDSYGGNSGVAMYNPSVHLMNDGALMVSWDQLGETTCHSEIIADSSGKLVERRRTTEEP